ncbi:MAG: hypothetical protein U0900_09970 [Myxococcota bacterium]
MSSSASSTNGNGAAGTADATGPERAAASRNGARHSALERAIARVLVAALVGAHPLPAFAGDEFGDANTATYDHGSVQLDNQQAGRTTFTIDTNKTTIGWQDLQQPANNRLEFNFTNGGHRSSVLNYSESINPIRISGQVVSNGTVGFANQTGVYVDGTAVIDVGSLVAIAGSLSRDAFQTGGAVQIPLQGRIENHGLIRADENVALLATSVLNAGQILAGDGNVLMIGGNRVELGDLDALRTGLAGGAGLRADLSGGEVVNAGRIEAANAAMAGGRVVNLGEIEIEDGSLLMVGADAVYLRKFDDPVLIRLPRGSVGTADAGTGSGEPARYAVENQGRIDAGRGHVRLAAADPLGFGIRQGSGSAGAPARIAAKKIELEAGEDGRVQLAGELDASDRSKKGRGGQIDVTGSIIALTGATVDASGTRGGGQIRIGGEEQGSGDLQRARAVLVDEASQIRADATGRGDGGRIIVFSENLTSVEGAVSARGGAKGGDGGFVETSGLDHFSIASAPDVSARRGRSGSWLIDPYDITIQNGRPECQSPRAVTCLDAAIDAILDPDFDNAGFDGIIRTNGGATNYISADLIERALGIGTNVTLSTQAFGDDPINGAGDITVADAISINSLAILEGKVARLTLLAAGNIFVNANIEVVPIGAGPNQRSNLALSVELHANDASQTKSGRAFDLDLVRGDVQINADITTGGGSLTATGISVRQAATSEIVTRGGNVALASGTISPVRVPFTVKRTTGTPTLDDDEDGDPQTDPTNTNGLTSITPILEVLGLIDTRTADGREDGGRVTLTGSSANAGSVTTGKDPIEVVTGLVRIAGDVFTGGAAIAVSGGAATDTSNTEFAGDVEITGTLDSGGGDVAIRANRVDPAAASKDFSITSVVPASDPGRGQGGTIAIDGTIRTNGGVVSIGNDTARSIALDGTLDTTSTNVRENGLVKLIARDSTAINSTSTSTTPATFGSGVITIGTNGATRIETAGLTLRTRDLTTGVAGGANAVDIVLRGRSSSTVFDVKLDTDPNNDNATGDQPAIGVFDAVASHAAVFNGNTELTAGTVRVTTAANPLEVTEAERANGENRLVFGGANGSGSTASDGVRINADELHLLVGDDSTPTSTLFADDLGTLASPTDLGIQRQTRGDYRGLQLRDRSGILRPGTIEIRQDGDLRITQGAASAAGELDLAGAFAGAAIGLDGMRISLESSDGVLRVDDAAGFNNNAGPLGSGDAGRSFVQLLGGLLLPDSPGGTNPDPETRTSPNSVVFGADVDQDGIGDQALGSGGSTAFDVESLTISTPGDLSITQQIASSIAAVADLLFESGRDTGIDGVAGRGTMTIAANTALAASSSLTLEAGHSGFGDLVFAGTGTSLRANELVVSAGSTTTSRNTDSTDPSRVVGLQAQAVTLRDATGAVFGDATSTATAFRYRQTAGIDAAVDLPTLAQFGLTAVGPTAGFRAAGDVEFAVRSDAGRIDLDDGVVGTNEADLFRNASLSLVGLQSGTLAPIVVSADTAFVGKHVELGGVAAFTFNADLARVFNRSGTDADESLTLRAGLGTPDRLTFSGSGSTPVTVKAPTIRLISGDGPGGDGGSTIDTRGAAFDLSGPIGTDRTFAYQMDGTFRVQDLPGVDAFVGGAAGLPNVLALRNDAGSIKIDDFDVAELPIAVASGPSRLVIEAQTVELNQKDGDDLELTTNPNLFLRLRANVLNLLAVVSSDANTESGRVRMGPRAGDTQRTTGTDADFDGESLLVEAFDADSALVTTGNLSSLSEEPDGSGLYDLSTGRGPTTITLNQDGSILASDLAHRNSFSGQLARTIVDDDEDQPIVTGYNLTSQLGTVTLTPENVNGSSLFVSGVAANPADGAIDFAPGTGATPGLFRLEGIDARTEQSIVVRAGTRLVATDTISLQAGQIDQPKDAVTAPLGSIRFSGSHGDGQVTRLEANKISLLAGPSFALTNPDANRDGKRDDIDPANLPKLDLTGLDELALAGDATTSKLSLRQNAAFDVVRGGTGDLLTGLEAGAAQAGAGGVEWNELELVSLQGQLRLSELGLLADETSHLTARTGTTKNSRVVVDMPNQADRAAPFDDFAQGVRIVTNDVKFRSSDPGTSINLATDKLVLVSQALALPVVTTVRTGGFTTPTQTQNGNVATTLTATVGRLRRDLDDDPDQVLRPIVRIEQAADFTNTELPRPSQYSILGLDGTTSRTSLSTLDIELTTTTPGATLTLDDAIRGRTTGSNLILRSAGDVAIDLTGLTPGYEDILDENGNPSYAALQLTSLDIEAAAGAGRITIAPFTIDAAIAALTLDTVGDQRFAGRTTLAGSFETTGRDVDFDGDVAQSGAPDAGLRVESNGRIRFAGDVGSATDRLAFLRIAFDGDSGTGQDSLTPTLAFGRRTDTDGDGVDETPVASNQTVFTRDAIEIKAFRKNADGTGQIEGRKRPANFATVAKALGNLTFDSLSSSFATSAGEKISVGGTLTINAPTSSAQFSDVSALVFRVFAFAVQFLARESSVTLDGKGQTHGDGGASISANELDLNYLVSVVPGSKRSTRFGVPDPATLGTSFPYPAFAIRPDGRVFTTADFRFSDTTGSLAERVPFLVPTGASRSELTGAFGPVRVPTYRTLIADPKRLADPERLRALAVVSRPTPNDVVLARLGGAAVIDDRDLAAGNRAGGLAGDPTVVVSEARLDATDSEAAIALYTKLFGQGDERTARVRSVLQSALDQYLEVHRSQRVVGFELRRFVKNRPSTLIEAYTTLEDLDALFRYHRRLGLSPGEYRRIQHGWLEKIQPDGISVEELSETIHPSRYVRGSDILDIFGQ